MLLKNFEKKSIDFFSNVNKNTVMKKYKKIFFFGYDLMTASKVSGIAYSMVWRHANNLAPISANHAILYHEHLGIPLCKLRPDLWTKEMSETMPVISKDSKAQAVKEG